MTVATIKVDVNGGPGGSGVMQLNVDGGIENYDGALTAVYSWVNGMQWLFPNDVTLTVNPLVEFHDEVAGTLTGDYTHSFTPNSVTGSASGGWAAGVGVRVDWKTGVIRDGRRVKGRTFLVPCGAEQFENNGTVVELSRGDLQTRAGTLISALQSASAPLQVWSRPRPSHPGFLTPVTQAVVPDKPAWLRTRRQ